MRQDKTLQQFISLVTSHKGKKTLAEASARFLKVTYKLADCLIVIPGTEHSKPMSYGDKPHYLPSIVLPEAGEGLMLPAKMTEQGWLRSELRTTYPVGWVIYRPKKSTRKLRSSSRQFEQLLTIFALALKSEVDNAELRRVEESFEERLDRSMHQLKRSNNKLVALDETKDEFITMASHQLRTPLTSIKGYVSMVLEGDAGELNEQQKKLLNQAFISSQRMVYLIADLLNVSRLRTGRFVIETKQTFLPDVIVGEMNQLTETAKAKGIKLRFDKPKEFPNLELDETKIRQVIMNFIDNAIHYTPDGGEVRVELEQRARSVELRVVDNGLGVPRAEQHKLFNKFFRADNARRVRPDGTGLGLFMAKKVIIAQGGALIFRSTEGQGSTFGFIFPLSSKTR